MSEVYTPAEFLNDYARVLRAGPYPRYPDIPDRLRMDPSTIGQDSLKRPIIPYDPDQPWTLAHYHRDAMGNSPKGVYVDEGTQRLTLVGEVPRWLAQGVGQCDSRNLPLHPYWREMVTSELGGVVTNGYYPNIGPQETSDLLLTAPVDGKLYALLVERKDPTVDAADPDDTNNNRSTADGPLAIPGGRVEPKDSKKAAGYEGRFTAAAIRGLREETGLSVKRNRADTFRCAGFDVDIRMILKGVWADRRTTLHAWPQGKAFAGMLPDIPDQPPVAGFNIKEAAWHLLDEFTINRLGKVASHEAIARRALLAYQTKGMLIQPDGTIVRQ